MIKCYNTMEGFQEIPGEVSLLLNISNCQQKCQGCHSPMLQTDIGEEITPTFLDFWISQGPFTCVCFMGEGNDPVSLIKALEYVKSKGLKTAVYSGQDITTAQWLCMYDCNINSAPTFLKLGPYVEELGSLNKTTTNQRLYQLTDYLQESNLYIFKDITDRFWRKLND